MKRRSATAGAVRPEVGAEGTAPARLPAPPAPLGRRGWLVIGAIVLLVNLPVLHLLVRSEPKASGHVPFSDDFTDPGTVGRNYRSYGGYPRMINGELLSPGTKNNPLWLDAALPHDVMVEVSARPISPDGGDPGDVVRQRDRRRHRLPGSARPVEPHGLAGTGSAPAWYAWTRTGRRSPAGSRGLAFRETCARPASERTRGCGSRRNRSLSRPARVQMRFERRGSVIAGWSTDG